MRVKSGAASFVAIALCTVGVSAHAAVIDFSLDSSTLTGTADGTVVFSGEITNNSGMTLNASDFFFNFTGYDGASLTPSQDLAVTTADFAIPNGVTTTSLDLFSVLVAPSPSSSSLTLQVQLEDSLNDLSGLKSAMIDVPTIPLSDSARYLAMGLLLCGFLAWRRHGAPL
jgi:hypothetical protein